MPGLPPKMSDKLQLDAGVRVEPIGRFGDKPKFVGPEVCRTPPQNNLVGSLGFGSRIGGGSGWSSGLRG